MPVTVPATGARTSRSTPVLDEKRREPTLLCRRAQLDEAIGLKFSRGLDGDIHLAHPGDGHAGQHKRKQGRSQKPGDRRLRRLKNFKRRRQELSFGALQPAVTARDGRGEIRAEDHRLAPAPSSY